MKAKLIRQGDVLLVPVKSLPSDAKDITPHGDIILKYGEVTGHAHRIVVERPGQARYWDAGAERYLQVLEKVSLLHEEHDDPSKVDADGILPGIYHLPQQVEWTDDDEPRVVAD